MRFPYSPSLLLVLLLLYGLQMIPGLGFLLLFLGSMFWSVVLINGAILGIFIEVPARKLSPLWLVFPVAYLGTYWVYVFNDYQNLSTLRAEIAKQNQLVRVPLNPARQALVFDNAPTLAPETHDISMIYSRAEIEGETVYNASFLAADPLCDEARDDSYRNAGIYPSWFHTRSDRIAGGKFVEGYCTIRMPVPSPSGQVQVGSTTRKYSLAGLPVEEVVTTIRTEQGTAFRLRAGRAKPLSLLPAPFLFCADFIYGGWKGECSGFFWRSDKGLIEGKWRFGRDGDLLAATLGVKRRDNFYDLPMANETIRTMMVQSRDRVLELELDKLDRAIADPMIEIGGVPFNSLRNRGDLIEPRLEGIVTAIEFGVTNQKNAAQNAQQMFNLLQYVSKDAIRPYEARLAVLWHQDRWFYWVPFDERMPPPETVGDPIVVNGEDANPAVQEDRELIELTATEPEAEGEPQRKKKPRPKGTRE